MADKENWDLVNNKKLWNRVIERTCNTLKGNKKYYFGSNDSTIDIKYTTWYFQPYISMFPVKNKNGLEEYNLCGPLFELIKFLSIHLKASVTLTLNHSPIYYNDDSSKFFIPFVHQVLLKLMLIR